MTSATLGLLCFHKAQDTICCGGPTRVSQHSYSSTWWWSQFEVIHSMLKTFSDVKKFLERDDLTPAISTKLLQVLDDPAKTRKLKIE